MRDISHQKKRTAFALSKCPPANCLDKNLLMKIQRTQKGGVMFSLDSGDYTVNKDNEMSQLQKRN
ncbi:MAG: DUF943 family protein [Pantoea sp. Pent]|nr:DUF943 family protein [Pantoea sp. Pent]